jgi:hypothetical protein
MKTSESVSNIFTALIKVLPEIKNLHPSAKGYGYDYIPLQDVIDEIKPKLKQLSLYFIQFPVSDSIEKIGVTTRIIHGSGEWIESTVFAAPTKNKNTNDAQAAGSTITYLRRYSLVSAFGITGDTDLDGKTDSENKSNNTYQNQNKPPYKTPYKAPNKPNNQSGPGEQNNNSYSQDNQDHNIPWDSNDQNKSDNVDQSKQGLIQEINKYKDKADAAKKSAIEQYLSKDPSTSSMVNYIEGFLKINIKL